MLWCSGLVLMFTVTGCDAEDLSESLEESTEGTNQETESGTESGDISCVTVIDCGDMPNNSVWEAICEGDILLTPEGSGDVLCVDGTCSVDSTLVETDCSDKGGCGESDEGDGYAACGTLE